MKDALGRRCASSGFICITYGDQMPAGRFLLYDANMFGSHDAGSDDPYCSAHFFPFGLRLRSTFELRRFHTSMCFRIAASVRKLNTKAPGPDVSFTS